MENKVSKEHFASTPNLMLGRRVQSYKKVAFAFFKWVTKSSKGFPPPSPFSHSLFLILLQGRDPLQPTNSHVCKQQMLRDFLSCWSIVVSCEISKRPMCGLAPIYIWFQLASLASAQLERSNRLIDSRFLQQSNSTMKDPKDPFPLLLPLPME